MIVFVLKPEYDINKSEIENKIPDTCGLVKKTDYNAKITEIEYKIPSISSLAANAALTAVKNKIPNINSLIKKTNYGAKITEIEKKIANHKLVENELKKSWTFLIRVILLVKVILEKMVHKIG